jgi:hypothetical protein
MMRSRKMTKRQMTKERHRIAMMKRQRMVKSKTMIKRAMMKSKTMMCRGSMRRM